MDSINEAALIKEKKVKLTKLPRPDGSGSLRPHYQKLSGTFKGLNILQLNGLPDGTRVAHCWMTQCDSKGKPIYASGNKNIATYSCNLGDNGKTLYVRFQCSEKVTPIHLAVMLTYA